MTNERAIELFKEVKAECEAKQTILSKQVFEYEGIEALDMAIKALEEQPCEDCISRDEAIRIAEQGQIQGYEWQSKKLCTLPSVTPQPKRGKWIDTNDYVTTAYGSLDYYKCSCCGEDSLEEGDYCPNCGADMREVKADEKEN